MIYGFWLGGKPMSDLAIKCTNTWPKDAKIFDNLDQLEAFLPEIKSYSYFYEALAANHYAAASDLFRILVLNVNGGIYLDTDVEIVNCNKLYELEKLAHDENKLIMGYEDNRHCCAAVLISSKDSSMSRRLLNYYKKTPFSETYPKKNISTRIFTGHAEDFPNEVIRLEEKIFYQWRWNEKISDTEKILRQQDERTVVTHHWEGTWL